MSSQNKLLTVLSLKMFHVPYLDSLLPFYSLLGAVMSVNDVLSVFLLRGMWH